MSSSTASIGSIQTASAAVGGTFALRTQQRAAVMPAASDSQAVSKADTVKLSSTAQVRSMKDSGASVNQIASSLGLTTDEVNMDLGITTSANSTSVTSIMAAMSGAKH